MDTQTAGTQTGTQTVLRLEVGQRRNAAARIAGLVVLSLTLITSPLALAQPWQHEEWGKERETEVNQLAPTPGVNRGGISREKATTLARRETGGRVLSATALDNGGYRVRILLDGGRVTTLLVDGQGQISKAR